MVSSSNQEEKILLKERLNQLKGNIKKLRKTLDRKLQRERLLLITLEIKKMNLSNQTLSSAETMMMKMNIKD